MATIREKLKGEVIEARSEDQKTTKFDEPAEIARIAGNIIGIPAILRPEKALEQLAAWVEGEQQRVTVMEEIDGIPIDAAHALMLAVKHEFGVVELNRGFWGPPPPFFSVPTDTLGNKVDVYVGSFSLPGFEGATFSSGPNNTDLNLNVQAMLRKKDLPLFKQLIATAREMLAKHSLYKGKAITINFAEESEDSGGGNGMLVPQFWDFSSDMPLIIAEETEEMLNATLWTPIKMLDQVKAMGTPIKRGILLYGTYGTGKTLTARQTAKIAVENGFTFLYVTAVSQLKKAIDFASKHYLPAVVFMEDTEKAFEDPAQINLIQNTMDGIDGKDRDLIVVLTTNFVEQLPASIMRQGRLDTLAKFNVADPPTAARLVKHYGGNLLDPESDWELIGKATQGNIPAAIREVVERSKLFALARVGSINFKINHVDIVRSARGMEEHMALLGRGGVPIPSPVEAFGTAMGVQIGSAVATAVATMVTGGAVVRTVGPKPPTVQ